MYYTPLDFQELNLIDNTMLPSNIQTRDSVVYWFFCRSLFQRAMSVLDFKLPDSWMGTAKDFFKIVLSTKGFVPIFKLEKYGLTFQPANLGGCGWYYQPTYALISNPEYSEQLDIGKDCELIKLTPDYSGIYDIVDYYAGKLATLDCGIDMSIINNKFAYLVGAKNKPAAEALKKLFDKINRGEPLVVFDESVLLKDDPNSKADPEPWNFLERSNLRESYLTTDQLQDFQTIMNSFDNEVGIPTVPYQKKERMVTSEAESRISDSSSRVTVWLESLEESIKDVNAMFPEANISVKYRFEDAMKGVDSNDDNT